MSPHLSTLKLNRYRYGELQGEDLAMAKSHLSECERCSKRLGAQQNNRAAFELEPVPPAMKEPAAAQPSWVGQWSTWLAMPMLAMAAILLIIPAVQPPTTGSGSIGDNTTTKGSHSHLEAWVQREVGPKALGQGDAVHPGDKIQLRVRQPPAAWVTLAGEDSTGTVEVYGTWQADGTDNGWQKAPFALSLDNTLGKQQFHAVFTASKPSAASVRKMIEAGAVPHPNHLETVTLENKK